MCIRDRVALFPTIFDIIKVRGHLRAILHCRVAGGCIQTGILPGTHPDRRVTGEYIVEYIIDIRPVQIDQAKANPFSIVKDIPVQHDVIRGKIGISVGKYQYIL